MLVSVTNALAYQRKIIGFVCNFDRIKFRWIIFVLLLLSLITFNFKYVVKKFLDLCASLETVFIKKI